MFEAVIFDMDGVLVDSEIVYFKWILQFMKENEYHIPRRYVEKLIGLSSKQSVQILADLLGSVQGSKLWNDYLEACEKYPFSYEKILNPGVREVLIFLSQKGLKIGLASASDKNEIKEMLLETDLTDYFDIVLSGEQFEESKPNPEIYCIAARLLGTTPQNCIVIEDSDYGIQAGKSAGAYVIAKQETRFNFQQDKADAIASDMWKVKEMLESLL